MAFDLGSTADGAASGASAGAAFGGIGAVVGGVVGAVAGGVFGSRSKKKKKTAARLARENQAIQRMTARKTAIIDAISQRAMAVASGAASGYDAEGTSSHVGVEQSIYGQIQSNLKTESMQHFRNEKIAKLLKQAGRYDNTFAFLKNAAGAAGSIKNSMGGTKADDLEEIDTSNMGKHR